MKILPVKITNQLTHLIQKPKKQQAVLPIITTPILTYYVGESQDKNVVEIIEFLKRKHIKVPEYLKPHADTQTGLNPQSQTKIKDVLTDAYYKGQITESDYQKYKNKVNFTGHSHAEDSFGENSDYDSDVDADVDVDDDGGIIDAILDFLDDLL